MFRSTTPHEDGIPRWATLFSFYQPVERYLQQLRTISGDSISPQVPFQAIDAFLMQQFVSYYPVPPTVIDLATDATAGMSTIFWASHPTIRQVIAPKVSWSPLAARAGRSSFIAAANTIGLEGNQLRSEVALDVPGGWEQLQPLIGPLSSVVFCLATPEAEADYLPERLDYLFQLTPETVILLFSIGRIGESSNLLSVLNYASQKQLRMVALRELSPFLASSRLSVLAPRTQPYVSLILERIEQLFAGNFQFLSLIQNATEAAQRIQTVEEELKQVQLKLARETTTRLHHEEALQTLYNQSLSTEIRHLFARVTPHPLKVALKFLTQRSWGGKV